MTIHTTNEDDYSFDDMSVGGQQYFYQGNAIRPNKVKTKFMNTFLINNMKVFVELFPNSLKLRYMSAFIHFRLFKNSFKAIFELSHNNSLLSGLKKMEVSGEESVSTTSSLAFIFGCGKGGDAYNSYTLGLQIIESFGKRQNQYLSKEAKFADVMD